ncbi:RimK/LysX family protein [bacterium]|nr:RimK/LysX family protein [bacterium]
MHKTTGTKLIGLTNPHNEPNWVVNVEARLDTGATRSSIDEGFISLLRLEELINEDAIKVKSANGTQRRDTVILVLVEDDEEVELEVSITNREHMGYPVILGRDYLGESE